MSIRQYRPRGKSRRGLTSKQSAVLYSALGVTIALQILYPLVHGGLLRILTLLIVYMGAAAMCTHAYLSYGAKYLSLYFSITFLFAFVIEQLGSRTGWPFGEYHYSTTLGFTVAGLPLVVPFAWVLMAHPILVLARKLTSTWTFLVGGFGLMTWDLFLDPQMVSAGRWSWKVVGPHVPFQPSIPLSNTAGWLLTGMGLIAILHKVLPKERRKMGAPVTAVEIFLSWTLFSGIVGNVFFFHTPGVAFIAGVPFLALMAPYYFTSHLGRPDQF